MRKTLLVSIGLMCLYALTHSCQGQDEIRKAQYYTHGHKLYTLHCENCHGSKGEGLAKLYPPLTDENYLIENRDKLASIVKYGMEGPIEINGVQYNTIMPGVESLSNQEIAYILTYITNSFGNEAPIFTLEEVNENLR